MPCPQPGESDGIQQPPQPGGSGARAGQEALSRLGGLGPGRWWLLPVRGKGAAEAGLPDERHVQDRAAPTPLPAGAGRVHRQPHAHCGRKQAGGPPGPETGRWMPAGATRGRPACPRHEPPTRPGHRRPTLPRVTGAGQLAERKVRLRLFEAVSGGSWCVTNSGSDRCLHPQLRRPPTDTGQEPLDTLR